MNKIILPLFILVLLSLTACSESEKHNDSVTTKQLEDAIIMQDWNLASHMAQRILMEELDPQTRYNALKIHIMASNNLSNYQAIIYVLENALNEFNKSEEQVFIQSELVKAYANKQDYAKAMEYTKGLMRTKSIKESEKIALELQIIEYALKNHSFGEAGIIFDSLKNKNIDPVKNKYYYLLINYSFLSQQYENAIKNIEIYLSFGNISKAERGRMYFLQGDCYEILGKNDKALMSFTKALESHPNPEVVKLRIDALEKTK